MSAHEAQCITQKFVGTEIRLVFRNIFEERPTSTWLKGTDGLLIGGSGDFSVHVPQSAPWIKGLRHLLDAALYQSLPGFGLCFGHQLLGYHLGGTVVTDPNHGELGTVEVGLTENGLRDPIFSTLGDTFMAHTGHSDYVMSTPAGVELLASNDATATQAFRVSGTHFYSTQFHPDMSGAEAQHRAHAYALGEGIAARFKKGSDDTNALLSRFAVQALGLNP